MKTFKDEDSACFVLYVTLYDQGWKLMQVGGWLRIRIGLLIPSIPRLNELQIQRGLWTMWPRPLV